MFTYHHWLATLNIHVYTASMEKVQILFPEPTLEELRKTAKELDVSLSEVIRRGTEAYLNMLPKKRKQNAVIPPLKEEKC